MTRIIIGLTESGYSFPEAMLAVQTGVTVRQDDNEYILTDDEGTWILPAGKEKGVLNDSGGLPCTDKDGDNYFHEGYCPNPYMSDCDDNDQRRNRGNIEICGDGIDNDCDYTVDESGKDECLSVCAVGDVACGVGCMAAGSTCCNPAEGGSCPEACCGPLYCMTAGGHCCDPSDGGFCAPPNICCGRKLCMPEDAVCCDGAGYCDAGNECCDNAGCMPAGSVCCHYGDGSYCPAGYECCKGDKCCPVGSGVQASSLVSRSAEFGPMIQVLRNHEFMTPIADE